MRILKPTPEKHPTLWKDSDLEHETRSSKRRIEEGSEGTQAVVDHIKGRVITESEFDVIRSMIDSL